MSSKLLHRLYAMLLPNNSGQLVPSYGGSAFETEAKERLPEADLDDTDGAVHLVMGQLAILGRNAIEAGDFSLLRRLFAFVARAVDRPDADSEIANAVALSFLEPADFTGPHGTAARELLPDRLRALIHEAV